MKVAVVTAAMRSGERGGAEGFYGGLVAAIGAAGHEVRQLAVPIDESTFDSILESYQRCYDLDTSAYDVVISTKAPTFALQHPRHISYLVHTLRVFYDRFESEYGTGTAEQQRQRRLIHDLDRCALHPSRVRRHFAIGHTSYRRLIDADRWWRGVPFSVLHLPAAHNAFMKPRRGQYVFMPGRLHRWKRPDLIVRAFRRIKHDIPLLIAGSGEDEALVRKAANGDRRIHFLGAISDGELLDLYAGATVVPFVPIQEDYGLVTIEAFKSQKPVITCTDSGEPLQFVKDGVTGFVVPPEERALADKIDFLVAHPKIAKEMGARGRAAVDDIRWESVVSTLLRSPRSSQRVSKSPLTTAARTRTPAPDQSALKVTVLDMQPIEPAIGGGRLRLLGLYHGLGDRVETTYVGTFDWPGERERRHQHSDTLVEIDVPLSDAHFTAAAAWQRLAGGKTVIDVSFPLLGDRSPEFVAAARSSADGADVIVFSHPWVYPLVRDVLDDRRKLVVYDAHNVESVLRYKLLGDTPLGSDLVRCASAIEFELCRRADIVLTCSHEERTLFNQLYGTPFAKCLVMPNGTFTTSQVAALSQSESKRQLGLDDRPLAIFLGSLYTPNEEAAAFICSRLAPALPHVTFAICGSVGSAIDRSALAAQGLDNVHIAGVLSDAARRAYLAAADIAINPMFSGQGTNIKMFDFMAAGLPIVTTPIGARGIIRSAEPAMRICRADDFAVAIAGFLSDPQRARQLAEAGRTLVSRSYSWERLSKHLGRLLTRRTERRRRPRFSIVIATYERQAHLPQLLACLARQTESDFEVILVDQSVARWTVPATFSNLDILYLHTDVKGAVQARNLGAWYAHGDVIAFTDDDCQPEADWLKHARPYFDNDQAVGVEGLIVSEKVNDPRYRAITNVGFEGTGFMTANLFLRRDVFNAIDGFDEQFDHPHFREDTDLGWRAARLGSIPFAHDVRVFHPPHPRTIDREGHAARLQFFEKDALLLKKHPERYRSLFLKEGHYRNTAGFSEHFARGALKYGVNIDAFLAELSLATTDGTRLRDV